MITFGVTRSYMTLHDLLSASATTCLTHLPALYPMVRPNRCCQEHSSDSLLCTLKVKVLVAQSYPTLCNPMDCSHQAPLSMECSRQQWRGLPFPSPGDLPNPGIEPRSSALQADSLLSDPPGKSTVYFSSS